MTLSDTGHISTAPTVGHAMKLSSGLKMVLCQTIRTEQVLILLRIGLPLPFKHNFGVPTWETEMLPILLIDHQQVLINFAKVLKSFN